MGVLNKVDSDGTSRKIETVSDLGEVESAETPSDSNSGSPITANKTELTNDNESLPSESGKKESLVDSIGNESGTDSREDESRMDSDMYCFPKSLVSATYQSVPMSFSMLLLFIHLCQIFLFLEPEKILSSGLNAVLGFALVAAMIVPIIWGIVFQTKIDYFALYELGFFLTTGVLFVCPSVNLVAHWWSSSLDVMSAFISSLGDMTGDYHSNIIPAQLVLSQIFVLLLMCLIYEKYFVSTPKRVKSDELKVELSSLINQGIENYIYSTEETDRRRKLIQMLRGIKKALENVDFKELVDIEPQTETSQNESDYRPQKKVSRSEPNREVNSVNENESHQTKFNGMPEITPTSN